VKAEVAAAVQASAMRFEHTNFSHGHSDVMFSLDDFEGKIVTHFCVCPVLCSELITPPWHHGLL
jgi:hypothetical protein